MKLYDKYFKDYLELNPELGSIMGIKKYHKFYTNTLSDEYINKNKQLSKKYIQLLSKLDNSEKNFDIFYNVFNYHLHQELNYYKFKFYLMPLNPTDNAISDFIEIVSGKGHIELKTDQNYTDMIYKIKDFCKWIDTAIIRMKEGIQTKNVISKRQCEAIIDDIKSALKSRVYLHEYPSNIDKNIKIRFTNAINKILEPKIREILDFLIYEYYCKCSDREGIKYLPSGLEMYKYCVDLHTTQFDLSIEEIHKIGLSEVKRIYKEMLSIQKKLGFNGSLKNFQDALKQNNNNFFKNEKDLLNRYREIRSEINENIMKKYFIDKVSHDYVLKSIPKFKESSTSAYYIMSSYDLKRKGVFYYDSSNLKGNPKNEMYVLSLHEGNPGHHYQITYCIDNKIPKFLFYLMENNAYAEGWALYCENFMDKSNLLEWYGKLNYEIMRSVRLVIDTGIHYYGWDFKKAYDYYNKYVFTTEKEAKSEILRYISLPGQALSYKIGEIYIKNLYFKLLNKTPDMDFSKRLQFFHHNILKFGPLPLYILKHLFD